MQHRRDACATKISHPVFGQIPLHITATESSLGGYCTMGVDTGRDLHVVILRDEGWHQKRHLIHLAVCRDFLDLDLFMNRFNISRCVVDGLPETHATREFAKRYPGRVFMGVFNEFQRGSAKWDRQAMTVQVNRTEALDASRTAVREQKVVLPRRLPIVEEFAKHMASDAKILDEDEETGIKKYRYIRTGVNHFSMAFTYAWLAGSDRVSYGGW